MTDAPTTNDPIELAMEAEARRAPPTGVAHEVLTRQSQLLGWQVAGARAAFALRMLGVAAALVVAVLVGLALWRAAQARGLVIEAFDVPPALAERGLTGKVLATQVQDRLDRMQAETVTPDAALTVSNRWSGDIAVQIPSTGVSLGEVDRLLRQWLGRETHVTGEAYAITRPDGGPGLALTVRTSAGAGAPAIGTEAGLDALIQSAAETVMRHTQPVLYATWLGQHGREAEALPVYRWLTVHGSAEEQGMGWLNLFVASPEPPERKYDLIARAGAADPENPRITMLLAGVNYRLGHVEAALDYKTRAEQLVRRSTRLSPDGRSNMIYASRSDRGYWLGAYLDSLADAEHQRRYGAAEVGAQGNRLLDAHVYALNHDVAGARGMVAETPPPPATVTAGEQRLYAQNLATVRAAELKALGRWSDLLALLDSYSAQARTPGADGFTTNPAFAMFKAEALARTGRHSQAGATIAGCGLDHYGCVLMRGLVAELAGDAKVADHWFAEADRMAPSFPQAPEQWGRALLARGQSDAAIAKAKTASRRSPRYGDPLELWGEALLAKGDAKGAAARFEQAAKLSPRWARLHLKWGHALTKLGRPAEAMAKYRAAAGMDLTPEERAELSRVLR